MTRSRINERQSALLLNLSHTAILIGYLVVWLPGPAAGLQFIGVELGEWIKFLGVGANRNLFYLPPITLALMMIINTASWPNRRWQSWAVRALAVIISLLSFPSIEAVRFEPNSEWLARLQLIGLVLVSVSFAWLASWKGTMTSRAGLKWSLLILVGLVGAVLPSWGYLSVRPLVSEAVGKPISIGIGVWMSGAGHLLAAAVSIANLPGMLLRNKQ